MLLTNARQASTSSSSSSASSTDEDAAQHAQRDNAKASADVTSGTAARLGAAADPEVPSPTTHAACAITSASNRAPPSQATLPTDTAAGCAVTSSVATTEAGTTAGSRSQSATCLHSPPGRAQQTVNYVSDKLQHGWHTVKSWLPKQLQKQLQKQMQNMMQLVLWGGVTEAANKCTGQGIAAQPWGRLDSWLTAPAEVQYQRYILSHSCQS